MSLISEEVIFETPGVIEKLTGENAGDIHPLLDVVQFVYGGEDDESDSGILIRGGRGMFYPIADSELVTKTDGTIEFSAFDGTYLIRKFTEEDSSLLTGYGITLTPQMMEEMMALDEQVGLDQSVEVLTNEAGELTAVVFDVSGLGTFFRSEGKWVPATPEEAAKYDGATTTDIEIDRAKELVERYDAGDKITEAELVDYAVKE